MEELRVRLHVWQSASDRTPRPALEDLHVADLITGLTPIVAANVLGVSRTKVWGYRQRNAPNAERRDKLLAAARECDLGMFWLRLRQKYY